jgi:glycosyltransferase involved in cell wall biosynthesis
MRILALHPSAEMYGSDRVFLLAIKAIAGKWPSAEVNCLLGATGPLCMLLQADVAKLHTLTLPKISRSSGARWMISNHLRSMKSAPTILTLARRSDLIYVSTITMPLLLLMLLPWRKRVLVHIHELPKSRFEHVLLSTIVRLCSGQRIGVSTAVGSAFACKVVLNGTQQPNNANFDEMSGPDSPTTGPLRVLMAARFLDWKGHRILASALREHNNISSPARLVVSIAGGPAQGAERLYDELKDDLNKSQSDTVTVVFRGFVVDPEDLYRDIDVLVAPSTRPEPFGMTIIEAMTRGIVPVASSLGGHLDIITHQESGLLFDVIDPTKLTQALDLLDSDRTLLRQLGGAARARVEAEFTTAHFAEHFISAAETAVGLSGSTARARGLCAI